MPARLLSGLPLATALNDALRPRVVAVTAKRGRPPRLALLGDAMAPGIAAYVERQTAFAADLGIAVTLEALPDSAVTADVVARMAMLSADPHVDGILPLLPLPAGIDGAAVLAALDPARDVDGLTAVSAGRLAQGLTGFVPCTAEAALRLAESVVGDLSGRRAVVVGASAVVGRPLAALLLRAGATVTICQITTRDLAAETRRAEVLFVAVGKAGLIGAEDVAPGSVVIDIGINRSRDAAGAMTIVGDVDRDAVLPVVAALSLVPDGVGPLTTATLMRNVVAAAEARAATS